MADSDPKALQALDALSDKVLLPAGTKSVPGAFEPRRADHLQSLVDVLENLPPAKPTRSSLNVQLCAPLLLGAKSLYDVLAAIWGLVGDGTAPSAAHLIALFFGVTFLSVACWAWGKLTQAFDDAQSRTDPHHGRILRRAQKQLAAENLREGAGDDGEEAPPQQ